MKGVQRYKPELVGNSLTFLFDRPIIQRKVHLRGANFGSLVYVLELLPKSFVKCEGACFCTSIIDIGSLRRERGHACNRDNMTVVSANKSRHELLKQQEVGDYVDVEDFSKT